MTIGQFKFKLNSKTLFKKEPTGSNWWVSKSFPFITFALETPTIVLPFYKKNEFGEWERTFCISALTLIQLNSCSDISWEVHFIVLGFGVSFIYQYGY
jgi:hypothetical protein